MGGLSAGMGNQGRGGYPLKHVVRMGYGSRNGV